MSAHSSKVRTPTGETHSELEPLVPGGIEAALDHLALERPSSQRELHVWVGQPDPVRPLESRGVGEVDGQRACMEGVVWWEKMATPTTHPPCGCATMSGMPPSRDSGS